MSLDDLLALAERVGATIVHTAGAVVIVVGKKSASTDGAARLAEADAAREAGVSVGVLQRARRNGELDFEARMRRIEAAGGPRRKREA